MISFLKILRFAKLLPILLATMFVASCAGSSTLMSAAQKENTERGIDWGGYNEAPIESNEFGRSRLERRVSAISGDNAPQILCDENGAHQVFTSHEAHRQAHFHQFGLPPAPKSDQRIAEDSTGFLPNAYDN